MNNYVMALFASGTTNFDYMGLGPLSDAISAIATETATSNGNITYTMEMSYPINGRLADKLVEGNLIKAQVSKTPGDFMIFEINETLKSDDRTITVYCDAYANRILRMSFDNGGKFGSFGNVQEALNAARAQMTGIQSDFTLSSGIGTRLNMSGVTSKNTMPTTYQDFNAYLDAIMDKVQGNVRFGINSIQIVSDRGRDITDTVLRDDKNTNGISIKVDTSNIVNRIIPILPVLDKDGNATQETKVGKIVTSSVAFKFINFYAGQVVSVDTQDLANSYFNRTNCDRPTTTATVQTSMLDEDLTDIRLFDRVQVYSSKIGYQAKLRVCERDFDILAGAVSEFKLGSSSVTVFNSQTNVVNAINSAVQSSQYAAITADGKNTAYYEGTNPSKPKENDLWFHSVDGINQIDQYVNGNWETIVSDSTGEQIRKKVDQVGAQAKAGEEEAKAAFDKATQLASKYDDTNSLANQAMLTAVSAQGEASSAVAAANSTASEFGRVDQKADSAVASALNAQSAASDAVAKANSTASGFGKVEESASNALSSALNAQSTASDAVKQASSAAADSKDAKQIAGAVSQSYTTLTDGSTMTIAELESGLAVKLTKTDLDGYATQTWTQNQVKMTADGINGTMSSIKSTVDSQTTSINDLKADSSSFKSQFTTVNNTLGKQTTDIGSLQASSKELTSGFNTLTTDNNTNKNDISQLKQTATEVSSTLETVQTQVQNSAVGTNLLKNTGDLSSTSTTSSWNTLFSSSQIYDSGIKSVSDVSAIIFSFDVYVPLNANVGDAVGIQLKGQNSKATNTRSNKWDTLIGEYRYAIKQDDLGKTIRASLSIQKDSNYQSFDTALADTASIVIRQSSHIPGFVYSRIKLEKGNVATDWCPNPADNATVTALSSLSQTVDGMKSDISKKIEQKDLNGYATQTWAQNQIKTTADGINATVSSVKKTVDGQTTSINDLKADSSGFKAQFTTVNNTIGKHTTDIGTLQATSKELTTGFNTLTSDNTTNKNDISQLKLTSTEVSSTLETVKTQVQDSAVGTNLLTGTDKDISITSHTTDGWPGWVHIDTGFSFEHGKTYTFSAEAKNSTDKIAEASIRVWESSTNTQVGVYAFPADGERHSVTIKIPTDSHNYHLLLYAGHAGIVPGVNVTTTYHHPKLEKGSLATDWCPNPADNATVTAFSQLSQTVDGMKSDISKKIEQKDLNGYATQTWAHNQINTTANGINGTISSVKNTVDGHTTSINNLQADSRGFKAQFTTVNNTVGKHTTDIGTLQASNKSLSASFDSLSSDNDANKHNISQLQASATTFNSTLMTVQQQVTDSAVGTNLLLKTGTSFSMTGRNIVNQAMQIYALSRRLEAGTTVTLSFDVVSTAFANFIIQNNASGDGGTWMEYIHNTADTTKKHYVATITLNGYSQQGIHFHVDNMPSTTTITISNMKLELGSYATDYSANPADNATVDAVSSISQTIDSIQTTVRGKADMSKVTQLDNQILSVVGQVNTFGKRNMVSNSQFQYDYLAGPSWWGGTTDMWYKSDAAWSWVNGYQGICFNQPTTTDDSVWYALHSRRIVIGQDISTPWSASAYLSVDTVGLDARITIEFYDNKGARIGLKETYKTSRGLELIKVENAVPPAGTETVSLTFQVHGGGYVAMICPMLNQGATAAAYTPNVTTGEDLQHAYSAINQTNDRISLRVEKNGVVNAINVTPEKIKISGNKLHITADTYIDNEIVKNSMIANLNADKLTAGSINAANINVYNINGANIVANSITADKIQAGAMLIAMNSTLQTLKVSTNGLLTTDRNGKVIGQIHTNRSVQHPENWGLDFDLNSDGKFMSWGAQNEGDPNGDYGIKFGWTRNSAASDFGMPWGGFWFNDNVTLHKNLRFDGGGIDVAGAYQLMKFAWINMNGTKYPFFGSSNLKAGWLFGTQETYLVRGGGVINASKILGVLNGQSYKFIKSLNPNGSVKVYTDVHF